MAEPGVTPQRLQQLQQSGYTGSYYDASGNMQQMNHGQTVAAPAAPAATGSSAPAPPAQGLGTQNAAGQNPLGNWTNWMSSGGVNPQGWQSLGGNINTSFLNPSSWSSGNVDPTQVQTNGDPYSSAQPFIDNAYSQATRELDPQWQQNQATFDQQMVNKGIAPGSAAYQQAQQQMSQQKNDAYSQAQGNALSQGLAAQAQSFGQGLSQSQLANQLAQSLIGANTSNANAQLSGNSSLMQALLGGNSQIAQQMISGQASNANAATAAGASRYAADLQNQLGNQAQNNSMLIQLLGLGQGVTQYNNGTQQQQFDDYGQIYGGLPGGGTGNIDVEQPYNSNYTQGLNSSIYNQQQNNAQNQNYANYAQMLMSLFGG